MSEAIRKAQELGCEEWTGRILRHPYEHHLPQAYEQKLRRYIEAKRLE